MFDHLVAITPDGPLVGQYFGTDKAAAMAWAQARNAEGQNVYFTINEVRPGLNTKATKADIARVRFAHVDIDPPKVGVWDKEAALIALLAQNPSVVIDSGNGWQGLWRLNRSVPHSEVEEINRGIAHALGADDRVWNVDRLFRVPGTVNYPSAAKRALGRVATRSDLVIDEPGLWYDPAALAAHYPAPARKSAEVAEVELGEWEVFDPPIPSDALRDLLWAEVPPGSRSEHAARLAHHMGREGYSLEQIMGTLMNPCWPWAGTIHDQVDPERQARRKLMGVRVAPKGEEMFPSVPGVERQTDTPAAQRVKQATGFSVRKGGFILSPADQLDHFRGCVYVTSLDRILMPNGTMLNQSRFDAVMGGHMFMTDETNQKSTRSAWEAFLKNGAYAPPIADERCFRPALPSLAIIQDGNRRLVNCYVPIETPRTKGDVSPFLDWLQRVYPNERDRAILLNYMASLVRNPGKKFFWWPVLQSTEGTGKGFILDMLMFCVGRQYSHLPNTSKLTRKGMDFNGWIENKLFIGLNEIYSANRRDFLEELKTTVTDSTIPIEGKGIEEATLDNYANGILFTNHPDGVPVTVDMRRYCVLYMAVQSRDDILKAGMDSRYFKRFWNWAKGEGEWAEHGEFYGYRAMNEFLRTMTLDPELDPADLATTAPKSSSSEAAVKASLGRAEQEVMEAVEQELPGFRGGWVSSVMLDRLLATSNANVPRNKRKAMMASLGYVLHPALHDGRVNNAVLPDGGKPRLYVLKGSPLLALTDPAQIADQYGKDQGA